MTTRFSDQILSIDSAFGRLSVTVTAEALEALGRHGAGARSEADLVAANREIIERVATMKFEADEGEDDFAVRIIATDLEP